MMGPATSYALEPYANEAGVASALVGFVQMAGGAALGLLAMALPIEPKLSLAIVMLAVYWRGKRAEPVNMSAASWKKYTNNGK